ncbi:CaiB/BaiF CoA transferase family protein [Ferruginivarius sediminum]|uniref:CoA transferase n=1 Tax=Ferruginivarius sediminum TaxID=2661937 RepID=A0A369T9J2_9PROT|nr:CoA transferase [Ferruginivarius sediminum]RDD61983.1 CoA transferase [Ferruginivarius sediminum]
MENKAQEGPLSGYRVIELGSMIAGPFCGRLLADFGAEVIKVEPPDGDPMRFMGYRKNDRSLYAASILRNKKLIALDLRTDEGQEVVRKLVANADFVLENFRPGTLERWGLGYEDLKAVNPRIIMIRISGYGQTGPYKSRPGYGIIGEAVSGLRGLNGDPDRPPPRVAVSLTDYISGLYGAFGAVMAANVRERTGVGQVVDTALYESAFSFIEPYIPAYDALGVVAERCGSRLPNNTPNNLFEARDGYIHITAGGDAVFRRLAQAMGQSELMEDSRFATALARNDNVEELERIIGEWTRTASVDEIESRLVEADVPAARIYSTKDIFEDQHFKARDMLVKRPAGDLGELTVTGIVPKLGDTPGSVRWLGHEIGADSDDVLRSVAQLTAEDISRLRAQGVIGAATGDSAGGEQHADRSKVGAGGS